MDTQKVCIIGGGLTGLIAAIVLSKLNLKVDLITDNSSEKIRPNRSTAISQNNYDFLKKLKIFKSLNKGFWSCSNMKLYTKKENEKIVRIMEFNNDKNNKNQLLYMIDNSVFIKNMIKNIKNNKRISLIKKSKVSSVVSSGLLKTVQSKSKNNSKYNLIIICTGNNSNLVNVVFDKKYVGHSYNEIAVTTILKHHYFKNKTARQFFLDDEILALLPISNTKTSIVWSLKKQILSKYKSKNNLLLKDKLKLYTKDFFKKIEFNNNFEFRDLNLLIRQKIHQDRILLFGDALHVVHPLAGQGFNMMLRDLISLEKILKNKIDLGLDIGSSDILSAFSNQIKPRNFAYSIGIDFFKKSFSLKNRTFKDLRNNIIFLLNKNILMKDIFFNLADKGLKF